MTVSQVIRQSRNSSEFEIRRSYHKGANAMFEFMIDYLKDHDRLPTLEGDLHIFWKLFHSKFD